MNYQATTLQQRDKRGNYYVWCTVPEELRKTLKRKQTRKTTGTSDLATAKQRQHSITKEIYAEFDRVRKDAINLDKKYARSLIESVATIIGVRLITGPKPDSLSQAERNVALLEKWGPLRKASSEEITEARRSAQNEHRKWLKTCPIFSFEHSPTYHQLIAAKRTIDLSVEFIFLNRLGFNVPYNLPFIPRELDKRNELMTYFNNNLTNDYWDMAIEEAFIRERLTEAERISHNEIRPTRFVNDFEQFGFEDFDAWYEDLSSTEAPDEYEQKLLGLESVLEAPQVRAKGLVATDTNNRAVSMDDIIPEYIKSKTWNREKTEKTAIRHLEIVSRILGNPEVKAVTQRDALEAFKAIVYEKRKDNGSTIKLATLNDIKSSATVFMRYCLISGYCDTNPFSDLDIKGLGADQTVDSYVPFEKAELHQLFSLQMEVEDHLLLSILITTGMRLDEAALLTWDQVKEEEGISYFSLLDSESQKVLVKTKGSLRRVPIPDVLRLPERGEGRLFSYKLDVDGKAQKEASKRLMRLVRKVTKMKTKTVHSLRGTFKDLLRDADVTKELNDYITGHAAGDVAGKYGAGFSLAKRYDAVNSVNHPWLTLETKDELL